MSAPPIVLPHQLATVLDGRRGIRMLSLDCFDTLLWRDVHAPADLFAVLEGVTPDQRKSAEATARKARVLALTGAKRWKGLPGVPTMQEAGFKDYNLINWFGLWLPAGAPAEIVSRIHAETLKALADPEVRQQFDAQGLEGVGMPSEEFAKFVAKV